MVGPGLIALLQEFIAQAEGQIVFLGSEEAGRCLAAGHIGEVAHAEGVFAVGGVGAVCTVVVLKDQTVGGEVIEGRGTLRVDEPAGEGLGADGDEVVALQQTGVFILLRSLLRGEVAVQSLKRLVVGGALQRLEIQVQDVVLLGVQVVVGHTQGDGQLGVLLPILGEEHILALQPGGGQ